MHSLESLGWNSYFANAFAEMAPAGRAPGRVVGEGQDIYTVATQAGETVARIAGKLRFSAQDRIDLPAVGDWVVLTAAGSGGDNHGESRIEATLRRRSAVVRKVAGRASGAQVIAANLDTLFIVQSLNQDLNPRRLERYLAMAWESGAQPVVLLTKSDLCDDVPRAAAELERVAIGAPVHALSALRPETLGVLAQYLREGRTAALVGSSGVGKSTLINVLLGREALPTLPVRAHDDRGRHATSARQLIRLPAEGAFRGMLIDSPGMRELAPWSSDGLDASFADIETLAAQCRFRDCTHAGEPGCAVAAAIACGELAAARLESRRKLQRELEYLERRKNPALEAAHEQKWRAIHCALKRNKKRG